jgi:hypothetical protein
MRLLSLLLREREYVREDYRSITFKRNYRRGDLEVILPVLNECSRIGLTVSINIDVARGEEKESLLLNSKIRPEGTALLLDNGENQEKLRTIVASARSVEHRPDLLYREVEKLIISSRASFEIEAYIEKSELTGHYDSKNPGSHYFWLMTESLKDYLKTNPHAFLRQIWRGRYPVIVSPTIKDLIQCNFCAICSDPDDVAFVDQDAFSVAKELAEEVLKHREAIPFLLALTLAPKDGKSQKLLTSGLEMTSVGLAQLPFGEGQTYDFKERPPGEIPKSIAAFANACGGLLTYGISSQGKVVGCDRVRDMDAVSNALKEIEPTVRHKFIRISISDKFLFSLLIYQPGKEVYTLADGKRPFRQGSANRSYRDNDQVLEAREAICT